MFDLSLPIAARHPFPLRTVVICLTVLAGLVGWQVQANWVRSQGLPAGLRATMTYERMAGDSFLPGSNKTLLRVFVIPRIVAQTIAAGRQPFLAAQYGADGYREWHETPVILDERWPEIRCDCIDPTEGPIGSFIEKTGVRIPVAPAVERAINDA